MITKKEKKKIEKKEYKKEYKKIKKEFDPVKRGAKKTKMEVHLLKNYVFEKISLGVTQKEISKITGYSEQYLCKLVQKIEDEYILEMGKDRDKLIKEQIMRLEGTIRKIMRTYDESDNPNVLQKLSAEIRANSEYIAKLRGLMINKVEFSGDVRDNLIDKFNIIKND